MNDELNMLLLEARSEILDLRRQNELLRARVDTMDLLATVLFTRPHQVAQGGSVDVAWKIMKAVEDARTGKP
jgi:hypothetical protein